jgi:hypothetical protein
MDPVAGLLAILILPSENRHLVVETLRKARQALKAGIACKVVRWLTSLLLVKTIPVQSWSTCSLRRFSILKERSLGPRLYNANAVRACAVISNERSRAS